MITNTKYHRITQNSPNYFRNPLKLIYIIITKPIDSINKYQIYNPSIDYQTSTTRNLSFVANQRTSSGRSFRRKPNFAQHSHTSTTTTTTIRASIRRSTKWINDSQEPEPATSTKAISSADTLRGEQVLPRKLIHYFWDMETGETLEAFAPVSHPL